jgi:hypothetical protein
MVKPAVGSSPMRRWMVDARRRAATTPGHLRMRSVVIAVVAVGLMAIGSGALVAGFTTVNRIQQHTVPAVVSMQHVHAWLADADRSAASAYLAGDFDPSVSQLQLDAGSAATNLDLLGRLNPDDPLLRYEADIAAASRELQRATDQNAADSDVSQRLQAIGQSVSYYASLIRSADTQGAQDPTAGTFYLQAGSNLLHGRDGILAQVDDLRDLYVVQLDGANLTLQILLAMVLLYAGVAISLLWLLIGTQRFLTARFRRRRNGRLVAATLLVGVIWLGGALGVLQAASSIKVGEDQAYTRLVNLWNAREILYQANANQSLGLVMRGKSTEFDQAFDSAAAQLVDRPLTDQMVRDAGHGQVRFGGLIASELKAASTAPERDAALHALAAYRSVMAADAAVRAQADAADTTRAQADAARAQAARNGKPPATPAPAATTVRLLSDRALVSAVDELDWYLGASMQMLQRQFDATMGGAQVTLVLTAGLEVLAVASAALTFWGLQPRIDEYR